MRIAIFDADLITRDKHRFPNLVCEKLSAYWKEKGAEVELITIYPSALEWEQWAEKYDEIYISKVFTDTPMPDYIEESEHIHMGGTGFYFDKAPNLPDEIEHHMPDYHLYDAWIKECVDTAKAEAESAQKPFNEARYMVQFKEYTDYSIGFLTRGCFRKCKFCVNQKYSHVFEHSPLSEFYDESRKKICLLDDNFMGCPTWKPLLQQLLDTRKSFKFKQGMDERILTDEKCRMLFSGHYDGDYTFAFDNVADYNLIEEKLKLIRKYAPAKASIKFYVLVGFESTDENDIANAFKRIELLMRYGCLPYIMRYQNKNDTPWKRSPFRDMYIQIARWANQPSMFKKKSFRQFCEANQALQTNNTICSCMRAMLDFEHEYPDIASKYFDLNFGSYTCSVESK